MTDFGKSLRRTKAIALLEIIENAVELVAEEKGICPDCVGSGESGPDQVCMSCDGDGSNNKKG